MIVADMHVHSTISPDALDIMDKMCARACDLGLKYICFTEHYEWYTSDYCGYPFNEVYLKKYFEEIEKCRQKYGEKLNILSGSEQGQAMIQKEKSQLVVHQHDFDFIIGSVHKLHNLDLGKVVYSPENVDTVMKTNLQYIRRMVQETDFDVLGHADLIKRYTCRQGVAVDYAKWDDHFKEIFSLLIQRGKGIEINTSGWRQEAGESLPGQRLLQLYRDVGGEILTIGSDAHCSDDLCGEFDLAENAAKKAGFARYCVFQNRKPKFISW